MKITLGSLSEMKLAALKEALLRVPQLDGVLFRNNTSSGENAQPMGPQETYQGALARAKGALELPDTDVGVGIENGIIRLSKEVYVDIAVIVLITPDNRRIVTTSEGIQFPTDCVKRAEELDFRRTTVGSVIAMKTGGRKDDPHATLTFGTIRRTVLLADALTTALLQL